jgi:hypothetical protein
MTRRAQKKEKIEDTYRQQAVLISLLLFFKIRNKKLHWVLWTRFIWLRIWASGELLRKR